MRAAPDAASRETGPDARRTRGSRWRVAARMALRQVLRDGRSSALIAALVALPLAGIAAAAVYADSQTPTPAEEAAVTLGGTAAWFEIVGGPDPDRRQYLDEPRFGMADTGEDGEPRYNAEGAPDSPASAVPPGTELLSLTPAAVEAETAGGLGSMSAIVGDVGDSRLDGRLILLDGTRPAGPDEAAASPAALARLGADIGDVITLTSPAAEFTLTAAMAQATDADGTERLLLPDPSGDLAASSGTSETTWFSPDWAPTAEELYALNAEGVVGYVPALAAAPGDAASPSATPDTMRALGLIGLVAAALVFCAYLVVLLAGAAFAVSARRQQRQLAMAASVGAGVRDVLRIVLLQGTVLGAIGGAVGIAAGIGIGVWVTRLDADGSATHPWGIHVPWLALAGVLVFAVVIGTLSALVPARAAAGRSALGALRGARRPVPVRADRPKWGTALLSVGLLLAAAGAALVFWVGTRPTWDDASTTLTAVGVAGIIAGPILLQLGTITAGHWLLSVVARLLGRVGPAARLAARDAVAAPSRVVPAFGAIAACAFLASAALGAVGVTTAQQTRLHGYRAPVGSVALSAEMTDRDAMEQVAPPQEFVDAALTALAGTLPERTATFDMTRLASPAEQGVSDEAPVVRAQLQRYEPCDERSGGPAGCQDDESALFGRPYGDADLGRFVIADAEDLTTITGVAIPDDALAVFRNGGAIVADDAWLTDDDELVVNTWRHDQLDGAAGRTPLSRVSVPAVAIEIGPLGRGHQLFVSSETANRLGMDDTVFGGAIASYATPPSVETLDLLTEQLSALSGRASDAEHEVFAYAILETGPPKAASWYALIVTGTLVLVIGASGVALGLARVERRADDATLAAIGATPRLRRALSFWQGLIIAGFGCVTGTVAGTLPVIGSTMASPAEGDAAMQIADVPWPFLAALAFVVPLVIAATGWLVPPRRPDLSRRTAIA